MSNEVNTTPVTLGEPEWRGTFTKRQLEEIVSGARPIKQDIYKALARKVLELEAALARMQGPVTDAKIQAQFPGAAWPEEVEKLRDGFNALMAARAAGKGNDGK